MAFYKEYKTLNLAALSEDILKYWSENKIFEKSIETRPESSQFVFYEGPPSANGLPGIHHVMARTIKDIFCRYKTLKGYQVKRKAGWDTHGLPVELGVEKSLGITKEDIGKKITVEQYNAECRKDVMKYTHKWRELTEKMGYWVDMEHPYITYTNDYIESVWWLLKELYQKGLLYKGYTIQPYSPAAGTGLSSHELNQPGCYRNVKDRTAIAQFKLIKTSDTKGLFNDINQDIYFLAWTTTPWTLPSNTALAVGKEIEYSLIKTINQYTGKKIAVILATDLINKHFNSQGQNKNIDDYKTGDKIIPYIELKRFAGNDLEGLRYEQLLSFAKPENGDAFKVIIGDFVTTDDGTGIVHIAPSFGADDFRVAKQYGIASLTLVDKRGKFLPEVQDGIYLYGSEYVKEAYLTEQEKTQEFEKQKQILEKAGKIKELKNYLSVDERIILKLQEEGKLFKKETYEHSYPHCWRTDKPILYYPLDSWFIKTTALKERMIELNKTINWKPEHTGSGRFGEWLNNLQDWNLSRSRFWGIPLPIWRNEEGTEEIVVGSLQQLKEEIDKSVAAGIMKSNPLTNFKQGDFSKENYSSFDLHKPFVDEIILVSDKGTPLKRESDLIDVWFDSGAMPYAQLHYPFENKELIDKKKYYPADFIAEGVDQTRGWFFTLHAIATMCFDSIAYKNVISNGLVLDKNGNKMSKRLGNAVDPFETLKTYGPDATRWYMITNAAPWDNLKFDIEGIVEVQRKFFGTLFNTYMFFAIYANIDGFNYKEEEIPYQQRPELDRWILSELNTLIEEVDKAYNDYEPHKAGRAIENFVDEYLSNWYVRLSRRRFWKGEYSQDKISAYQTLYQCMLTVAKLASPIAPFYMEQLYNDLNSVTKKENFESVHLCYFPVCNKQLIDKKLEEQMQLAQKISSMILSIRKKENIRVRQPLSKVQIPVLSQELKDNITKVKDLILSEVNVKELEIVDEKNTNITKKLKLNFKTLGKKYGKILKLLQQYVQENESKIITDIEQKGNSLITIEEQQIILEANDVEIIPVDIPGWKVANNGPLTVALDITINEELRNEGIARELVNRIQNLRKEKEYYVTDKITLKIKNVNDFKQAIEKNLTYICAETLATSVDFVDQINESVAEKVELDENISIFLEISKSN